MGVGILAKRVVLELSSSTNFVYSLRPGKLPGLQTFQRVFCCLFIPPTNSPDTRRLRSAVQMPPPLQAYPPCK